MMAGVFSTESGEREDRFLPEIDRKGNVLLYESELFINNEKVAQWTWVNKKKAQEAAAQNYYEFIKNGKNWQN